MVISHYLKRAPKLLAPVKRGGPVPLLSHLDRDPPAQGRRRDHRALELPVRHRHLRRDPGADGRQRRSCSSPTTRPRSPRCTASRCSRRPACPKGLFQVVCGEGPDVGPTLIDNANYVMFTGSTATGRVDRRAGRPQPDRLLPRARRQEPDDRARRTPTSTRSCRARCSAAFGNTGQICMHIERMYLPDVDVRRVQGPLRRGDRGAEARGVVRLRAGASARWSRPTTRTGSPSHVEDAVAKGATVLTGGTRAARPRPGVLRADDPRGRHQGHAGRRHARRSARSSRCTATRTVDEAVALANDTDYGLNASVWGGDLERRRARSAGGSSRATSTSTTSSPRRTPPRARRPAASSSPASAPATATRAC